jgi:hypothetical protein
MAFNLGRPALFAAEETIRFAREFLEHPLAIATDSRLVAACELLTHRCAYYDLRGEKYLTQLLVPLHQPFAILPNTSSITDLDEKLKQFEAKHQEWYRHWDAYLESKGVPQGSFIREARKYSDRLEVLADMPSCYAAVQRRVSDVCP